MYKVRTLGLFCSTTGPCFQVFGAFWKVNCGRNHTKRVNKFCIASESSPAFCFVKFVGYVVNVFHVF